MNIAICDNEEMFVTIRIFNYIGIIYHVINSITIYLTKKDYKKQKKTIYI